MAEAYYAAIAPHNPLGPISLAAGVQIAASIPNFLCQEQVSLGEGYLKKPFVVQDGYLDLPTGPGLGIELDETPWRGKIGHDWAQPRDLRRGRRLGGGLVVFADILLKGSRQGLQPRRPLLFTQIYPLLRGWISWLFFHVVWERSLDCARSLNNSDNSVNCRSRSWFWSLLV